MKEWAGIQVLTAFLDLFDSVLLLFAFIIAGFVLIEWILGRAIPKSLRISFNIMGILWVLNIWRLILFH